MVDTAAKPSVPNPYVGPVPFLEGQKLYGRVHETDALYNLLISKRIVLLFSPSGAGKTSLIQAALLPRLRSRLNPLPIIRLDRAPNVEDRQANRYVLSTIHSIESRFPQLEKIKHEQMPSQTFGEYLSQRLAVSRGNESAKLPLIILDQFEELFTLNRFDWKEKEDFLRQLGQALGGAAAPNGDQEAVDEKVNTPPTWALLSMREDYVAELEPFLDLFPTGLAYRYRLEPLEKNKALEAVRGPAGVYFQEDAAELLVDNLSKLRAQTPTGEEKWEEGRFVEPVHLQVVCQRLWDKVVKDKERPITLDDVASSKQEDEVDAALSAYYDLAVEYATHETGVRQRDLRDWIQHELITRTKIRTKTLREPAAMRNLDAAVKLLVKGHVLRVDVTGDREWIELSHDRLINPVLKSNEEWRCEHLALMQKQARLWAEAGKSRRELLFFGVELDEAERFAAQHPEELSRDEEEFLQESRIERKRVVDDLHKKSQIEHQNEQLRKHRVILGVISAVMIVLTVLCGYLAVDNHLKKTTIENTNIELEKTTQDLRSSLQNERQLQEGLKIANSNLENYLTSSQMLQAVAMAREGRGLDALGVLLQAKKAIEERKPDDLRAKFELSLMEILGKVPPVTLDVGRHSHIVRAVQFSADGKLLFSGGWDEKLKIWPLEPKKKEFVIGAHGSNIYSLAYHDTTQVLASCDEEGLVIIWRVLDGQLQKLSQLTADQSGHKKQVADADFNSDGTLLATASWDKLIVLWNVSDPVKPIKIAAFGNSFHQAPIYRIGFIEAGKHAGKLISADFNGNVGLWSMPKTSNAVLKQPDVALTTKSVVENEVPIFSMAVSPDGRWLAVGDFDGDVLIWDLETPGAKISGKRLKPNLSHKDKVFGMAFSPSGRTLVTVGSDEVLLKWDFPSAPKDVADLEKNIRVRKVEGWGEKLYCVSFHPKRDCTVAVGGGKSVRIADLDLLNPLATDLGALDRFAPSWRAAAMTPDSTLLAAMTSDQHRIYFWRNSTEGYQPVEILTIGSPSSFAGLSIHPNGRSIATLTCEGELTLWQLPETGSPSPAVLRKATPHSGRCPTASLTFSNDGKMLADAMGMKLDLWTDVGSGHWQNIELAMFDKTIQSVSFSAKDDLLAAAGEFEKIIVWEIADGKANPAHFETRELLQESVQVLAFSPDGQTLVSGSNDAVVREWKLPGLYKVEESALHKRAVTSLKFGVRGNLPFLISADREGQLVACAGGVRDEQCVHIGRVQGTSDNCLAAGADLNHLVVAGDRLWFWDLSPEAMIEVAERFAAKKQGQSAW